MLDGRAKTLHPNIHGGILADRTKPEHLASLDEYGIEPIDLVICNLYPFRSDPSIELIDIGGPTMCVPQQRTMRASESLLTPTTMKPCSQNYPNRDSH